MVTDHRAGSTHSATGFLLFSGVVWVIIVLDVFVIWVLTAPGRDGAR